MKHVLTVSALLPMLSGVAISAFLFILGDTSDAPGVALVGFTLGLLLLIWGIHNTGMVRKGVLLPCLLFCFGTGGIVLSIVLLADGELGKSPSLALIGMGLGLVLFLVGAVLLRRRSTLLKASHPALYETGTKGFLERMELFYGKYKAILYAFLKHLFYVP